jgi:cyclopropane-fatty-acyl-phospholipid synthase
MSTIISTLPSAKSRAADTSGEWFAQLLAAADIHLNGSRPWDIQINNPPTIGRIMRDGSLGLGESYMDGWWDCQAIDQMMTRAVRARLHEHMGTPRAHVQSWFSQWSKRMPMSTARIVGRAQYDFNNQLFSAMLDKSMSNSSAYWQEGATTLEQAQEAKMEMVCRKLQLKPGMRLLDMGCGWGSFMRYAAKHYGVSALGITNSKEQMLLGQSMNEGLPVQFEYSDIRQFNANSRSRFDVVVSLGMLNNPIFGNEPALFNTAMRSLHKEGLFLLETMGNNQRNQLMEPWYEKHISGQAKLPSLSDITDLAQMHFVVEDVHNLGADHDRTLLNWHQRFELAWPQLRLVYDERFYRMWRYQLLGSAGSFRARSSQIWQMVMSPKGLSSVYRRAY